MGGGLFFRILCVLISGLRAFEGPTCESQISAIKNFSVSSDETIKNESSYRQ